jgi:hypothetical protein
VPGTGAAKAFSGSAFHWQPVRSTTRWPRKPPAPAGFAPTAGLADEGGLRVTLTSGRDQLNPTPERIRHFPRLDSHAPTLQQERELHYRLITDKF